MAIFDQPFIEFDSGYPAGVSSHDFDMPSSYELNRSDPYPQDSEGWQHLRKQLAMEARWYNEAALCPRCHTNRFERFGCDCIFWCMVKR